MKEKNINLESRGGPNIRESSITSWARRGMNSMLGRFGVLYLSEGIKDHMGQQNDNLFCDMFSVQCRDYSLIFSFYQIYLLMMITFFIGCSRKNRV